MAIRKICRSCSRSLGISHYGKKPTNRDGHRNQCNQCQRLESRKRYHDNLIQERQRQRENYRKIKAEVLEHYGNVCKCCGEPEPDFLAIDHIHNDGAKHRKKLRLLGTGMYYWLKRNNYPNDFQLLCHNCNWSKHANNGMCIHKIKS